MYSVTRIAVREYRAVVRTKGFIASLVLAPIIMGSGGIVMALFPDHDGPNTLRVAVVDRSGVLLQQMQTVIAARSAAFDTESAPRLVLQGIDPTDDPVAQRRELDSQIRAGRLRGYLEVGAAILQPQTDDADAVAVYYAVNPVLDPARTRLADIVNDALRTMRLQALGVLEPDAREVMAWLPVRAMRVSRRQSSTHRANVTPSNELDAIIIPIVPVALLFILLMLGAMPQMNAVMEEKQQRIAEVILGSARPFHFMLGKLVGGVGVALTAGTVYLLAAIIAAARYGVISYVDLRLVPWFVVYVVMATLMYGALLAALGAACNDVSEAQAMVMPALLPMLTPLMLMIPVVKDPYSAFSTLVSLLPPFTPLLMLLRQGTPGGVPWWQPWLGLVGVGVTTAGLIWIGGRVFRVAILMQGVPPRLGNLLRWGLHG